MLTQSCKPNNNPSNVNAPTKTTGCRKEGTVRFLIFRNKFSGDPAFYTQTQPRSLFRNWKEEAIGPRNDPSDAYAIRSGRKISFAVPSL